MTPDAVEIGTHSLLSNNLNVTTPAYKHNVMSRWGKIGYTCAFSQNLAIHFCLLICCYTLRIILGIEEAYID